MLICFELGKTFFFSYWLLNSNDRQNVSLFQHNIAQKALHHDKGVDRKFDISVDSLIIYVLSHLLNIGTDFRVLTISNQIPGYI